MSFRDGGFRFAVWILPLGLLPGCASTQQEAQAHRATPVVREVVGTGTQDDRAAIENTNEQMLNAEHASTPVASPELNTESTNLP